LQLMVYIYKDQTRLALIVAGLKGMCSLQQSLYHRRPSKK